MRSLMPSIAVWAIGLAGCSSYDHLHYGDPGCMTLQGVEQTKVITRASGQGKNSRTLTSRSTRTIDTAECGVIRTVSGK